MSKESPERPLGAYLSAGVEFVAAFGLLLAIGIVLDLRFGTLPGLTISGAVAGFGLALYRLIALTRPRRRDDDQTDDPTER